jgi:hypothetical protein
VGVLIPEKALPELLAELQSPLDGAGQPRPLPEGSGNPSSSGAGARSGSSALRGSLYDIMAGLRRG